MDKKKNPHRPYTLVAENDFEKLEEAARKAAEKAKEPSFNKKQLEEAKQEAFERGREQGHREALSNQEERIANSLDSMLEKLDHLISHQAVSEALQEKEAVAMSVAIIRKIMPNLIRNYGVEEIERIIKKALSNNVKIRDINVLANPDMIPALEERLTHIIQEFGYEERVVFKEDRTLALSDCKVEWGNGGIARIVPDVWEEIEIQITNFLNGHPVEDYLHGDIDPFERLGIRDENDDEETVPRNKRESQKPEMEDHDDRQATLAFDLDDDILTIDKQEQDGGPE